MASSSMLPRLGAGLSAGLTVETDEGTLDNEDMEESDGARVKGRDVPTGTLSGTRDWEVCSTAVTTCMTASEDAFLLEAGAT